MIECDLALTKVFIVKEVTGCLPVCSQNLFSMKILVGPGKVNNNFLGVYH